MSGAGKIVSVSGGDLPVTQFVPPGQKLEFEVEYEGCQPSQSAEDIVAYASVSASSPESSSKLTSVKVQLTAVYEAPENPNPSRHVYGVGELVVLEAWPKLSSIILSTQKLDVDDDDEGSAYEYFEGRQTMVNACASRTYTCPISASYHPPIQVTTAGVSYTPTILIIEPQSVVTPGASHGANVIELFYEGNRYCWPYGTVGSACLVTTNYIGPMDVSFQGIAVSEVPCDEEDVITGCFTNGHYRTHTTAAGAGKAYYIQQGNFWFVDGARSAQPELAWIPDSVLNWRIPVGWHRKIAGTSGWYGVQAPDYEQRWNDISRPLLIGGRTNLYEQRWSIDTNGTVRTDKFGHWISRTRWCEIILDGAVIQAGHP